MAVIRFGDRITVRLSEAHEIGGNQLHPGKFVRFHHGNTGWADVELDQEHAGGVRRLSVPVECIEKEAASA